MRSLFYVLSFLMSFSAFAEFDASLSGSYRSTPLGGGANAVGGYNYLFWGERGGGNHFYGLVRPFVELSSSGSFASATANLEIFPISFVGFKFGRELNSNSKDYDDFNCRVVDCTGGRAKDFAEIKFAFRSGGLFAQLKERREWHHREGQDARGFAEPASSLVLDASGKDLLTVSQIGIGHVLSERMSMLIGEVASISAASEMRSRQSFLGVTYGVGKFSLFASIGRWKTDRRTDIPTNVLLYGSWVLSPSWALF